MLWEGSVEGKSRSQTVLPNCLPQCHIFCGGAWPHNVQDITQPLHFPQWKLNLNYLWVILPGLDLKGHAHLGQVNHLELIGAELEG